MALTDDNTAVLAADFHRARDGNDEPFTALASSLTRTIETRGASH